MESMRAQFERESELETAWTSYNPSLGRPLLNSKKFLEKKPAAPPVEEAAQSAAPDVVVSESIQVPLAMQPDDFEEEASSEPPEKPGTEVSAAVIGAAEQKPASPLEALQRKFEMHKVTPVGNKNN
jgi:hypothetical protein